VAAKPLPPTPLSIPRLRLGKPEAIDTSSAGGCAAGSRAARARRRSAKEATEAPDYADSERHALCDTINM
jgi:hypothetical protein